MRARISCHQSGFQESRSGSLGTGATFGANFGGAADRASVRRRAAIWVLPVLVAFASACDPAGSNAGKPTPSGSVSPSASATVTSAVTAATDTVSAPAASPAVPPTGTAAAALAALQIKGRAPKTGYSRAQFGPAWADVDRNGCDTRNDILARDLTASSFQPGTHDCIVVTGTLLDPYSGTTIAFRRGQTTSEAVQIDHVVALSDAWQTGAQQLDLARRTALANDPLNLLAVDGPLNMQKSDSDAASWLPPNKSFRCAYVARQVAVKTVYALWVTQAEHDAIAGILQGCPDEPLPSSGRSAPVTTAAPANPIPPEPPAATTPSAVPPPPPPAPSATRVVPAGPFANCAAARAAGAAPLHRGDPGYSPKLDRDGDGVACE